MYRPTTDACQLSNSCFAAAFCLTYSNGDLQTVGELLLFCSLVDTVWNYNLISDSYWRKCH